MADVARFHIRDCVSYHADHAKMEPKPDAHPIALVTSKVVGWEEFPHKGTGLILVWFYLTNKDEVYGFIHPDVLDKVANTIGDVVKIA